MKPSTFLLVPLAALTAAQFHHEPRAADGVVVRDQFLPQRAEFARAKGSATAGGASAASATAKASATKAGGAKTTGGAAATGGGSKSTSSASSSGAKASSTTVTTNGASAGHDVGVLRSGLLTAGGVALGFAWFM